MYTYTAWSQFTLEQYDQISKAKEFPYIEVICLSRSWLAYGFSTHYVSILCALFRVPIACLSLELFPRELLYVIVGAIILYGYGSKDEWVTLISLSHAYTTHNTRAHWWLALVRKSLRWLLPSVDGGSSHYAIHNKLNYILYTEGLSP